LTYDSLTLTVQVFDARCFVHSTTPPTNKHNNQNCYLMRAVILLADRTATHCMVGYWHRTVVCPSVCLSVCLSCCALWRDDTCSNSVGTSQ